MRYTENSQLSELRHPLHRRVRIRIVRLLEALAAAGVMTALAVTFVLSDSANASDGSIGGVPQNGSPDLSDVADAVLAGNDAFPVRKLFSVHPRPDSIRLYSDGVLVHDFTALCVENADLASSGMTESPTLIRVSVIKIYETGAMIDATR